MACDVSPVAMFWFSLTWLPFADNWMIFNKFLEKEKNKWSKQDWVSINKGLGRESGGQN